jgi:uncharacterized pyridoxal phosphate-containing UPF0001 family protein
LEELGKLSSLEIRGLMCIPDPKASPAAFARLRELMDTLNSQGAYPRRLRELSMGMSADFAEAIRAGATMVRIGTALFGERAK